MADLRQANGNLALLILVIPIVGTSVSGNPINSPTHRQLPAIAEHGFQAAIILPNDSTEALAEPFCAGRRFALATPALCAYGTKIATSDSHILAELREARFGSFDRLLASYVFFWWLSKKVASFPFLRYRYWKPQRRTRIMITAAPVS